MPWAQFQQKERKERIEKVEKRVKQQGGKDRIKTGELIQWCMDELGCTRRKAIEYIDVATS